jgi:H+/Cl- antiporter ClcA
MERTGKGIIIAGIIIVVVGIVVWLLGDKLRFLGRLPGDIRIERENFRVYIPITTMLLISVLISVILWLVRKFD